MKSLLVLVAITTLLVASPAATALDVLACEPEWGSLVKEIAGESANLTTATTAFQDPHSIQARPSLIAAARSADLVICSGADLEVGWLPLLLRRSGNAHIQPGSPGYFLAADYVRKLEIPKLIDRSQGDVHPQGNPHVQLSPRNIERVARALAERLIELDPANGPVYRSNLEDFLSRWGKARTDWAARISALEGLRIVTYHLSFSYLADWLGLNVVATLEPRPGVPPSGAQLAKLLTQLNTDPPAAIVRTPYENERPAAWLSERLKVPVVVLPYTIGGNDQAVDLFSLYSSTLDALTQAAQ